MSLYGAGGRTSSPGSDVWPCPACTYENPASRRRCEMCHEARPVDAGASGAFDARTSHRGFGRDSPPPPPIGAPGDGDGYGGDDFSARPPRDKKQQDCGDDERLAQWMQYAQYDDICLVNNTEPFECSICFTEVAPRKGAILHQCLHQFCLECLKGHIQATTTASIPCPFRGDNYACDAILEDREVRKILGKEGMEDYQKFLARSVQAAEAEAGQKAFHCQSPNCAGWWIVDDRVLAANWFQRRGNLIKCPVCNEGNCIQCRVIHKGMNCKEYQDDIRRRATNDNDARVTQDGLEAMLRNGEAQRCPRCNVIIIKHGGCTHMKCTMCQIDFTWTGRDQ